jgi:hypothetical protein
MNQAAVAVMPQPRGEQSFYAGNGVQVTNARFVVGAQMYSLANVTSVSYGSPKRGWAYALIAFVALSLPAFILSGNPGLMVVGAGLLLLGILLAVYAPSTVVLATASGEVRALRSRNHKVTLHVIHALNEAIISRG